MRLLRVLRGIVKTAITWAVVWVPVSLIPVGIGALFGLQISARALGILVLSQAVTGAINGGVFASIMALAGRKKTFETLSLPWIAVCGAIGGVVFPVVIRSLLFTLFVAPIAFGTVAWTLAINAALGAGLATLSLSIARKAPALPRDRGTTVPAIDAG